MPIRFIIIDNDPVNNLLCSLAIRDVYKDAEIMTFNFPIDGFNYLAKNYTNITNLTTLLLLDINMPSWSGWDFLDNFEKLDDAVKEEVKIYILSSSIDVNDKHRASINKYVADYIEKPLSGNTVLAMSDKQKFN